MGKIKLEKPTCSMFDKAAAKRWQDAIVYKSKSTSYPDAVKGCQDASSTSNQSIRDNGGELLSFSSKSFKLASP